MSDLPENWIETTLGEIALWGSGGTPNRNISEYFGGKIPWFKTGELNEGIVTEAEEYLTDEGLKNSSAKIFPKGSIIIAMYGATIGKCAILGVDGSTNQACAVAQPKKEVEPVYLFHYLRSQKQNFIDKGKGGAQPNISQTVIKEHPIPLPPVPEQKRIVEKLETLFAHLDQLKARLENIPTLLKQFRQAVLTQAVTGKLTEEWREGKNLNAIEILEQFLLHNELLDYNKLRTKPSLSVRTRSYESQLSKGWIWKKIRELVEFKAIVDIQDGNHGSLYPRKSDFRDEGVLFLSAENVVDGHIRIDALPRLDNNVAKKLRIGFAKPNDVILTHNATVGRVAIIPEGAEDIILSTSTTYYRCSTEILLPKFLMLALMSDLFQSQLVEIMSQTTRNQVSITKQVELGLPFCHIDEQKEIVRRVESLFAVANRIEASYNTMQEKMNRLPQAILSKAFKGELIQS